MYSAKDLAGWMQSILQDASYPLPCVTVLIHLSATCYHQLYTFISAPWSTIFNLSTSFFSGMFCHPQYNPSMLSMSSFWTVFIATCFCLITVIILALVIVLSLSPHYWSKVNVNGSHAAKPLFASLETSSNNEMEMHVDLFKNELVLFQAIQSFQS